MDFSWHIFVKWWPRIWQATGITIEVFLLAAVFSVLLGTVVAALLSLKIRWLTIVLRVYISIFRNTPLLVQLFFLYFGLPAINIRMSPLVTGVVGISLNEGAFMAEIIRGNIEAIRKGDWEAAESLALSKIQVLRYVILPQALRDAVPAVTGQLSIIVKDTSLLSLIMIVELTRVSNQIYTRLFDMTGFSVAAIIYITIFLMLTSLAKMIERLVRVRR
jgi:His/Glu/Gln/Arg/opine family amino acid ABC transporter permease subunit